MDSLPYHFCSPHNSAEHGSNTAEKTPPCSVAITTPIHLPLTLSGAKPAYDLRNQSNSQSLNPSSTWLLGLTHARHMVSSSFVNGSIAPVMEGQDQTVEDSADTTTYKTTADHSKLPIEQTVTHPNDHPVATSFVQKHYSIPLSQMEPALGRPLAAAGLVKLALSWTTRDGFPEPVADYGRDESPMGWCPAPGRGVGYRCCACQWDTLKDNGEAACSACGHVLCSDRCFEF